MIKKDKSGQMISIIVPAYNEEKKIEQTMKKLTKISKKMNGEIIAIDDGSEDETGRIAGKYAAVFRNEKNQGKGASMRTGAQKARKNTLVFIDASQFEPAEIPRLIKRMKETKAKMAVGIRDFSTIPWPRKITNALTKLAIFIGTGKIIKDPLSGFRAVGKKDFLSLATKEDRYTIEAEINFKALLKGWPIEEVPVSTIYEGMPAMRIGNSKAPLSAFLKQRFLHESLFNIKSVLKIWFTGSL
jgi:glycosyltransferase involved in cell wall biosynthesis